MALVELDTRRLGGDGVELTDQIEIVCGSGAVGHKDEAIPPTSTHADSPGKDACDPLCQES